MNEMLCTQCGSVWSLGLSSRCAFCGGPSREVPRGIPAPSKIEGGDRLAFDAEVGPREEILFQLRPEPSDRAPEPASSSTVPAHDLVHLIPSLGARFEVHEQGGAPTRDAPAIVAAPTFATAGAVPILPARVLPLLGLLAILSCAILFAAMWDEGSYALPTSVVVVCGLLLLLAPLAWVTARAHEARCRSLAMNSPESVQVGKVLGIVGTLLVLFVVAWFLFQGIGSEIRTLPLTVGK